MAHPSIALCATISVPHPKWDERPALVAVLKKDASLTLEELNEFLKSESDLAHWWLPDHLIVVEDMPMTATGKIEKKALREQFRGFAKN